MWLRIDDIVVSRSEDTHSFPERQRCFCLSHINFASINVDTNRNLDVRTDVDINFLGDDSVMSVSFGAKSTKSRLILA